MTQQTSQKARREPPKDIFKGSPDPTPDQAIESGEPTITGSTSDQTNSLRQCADRPADKTNAQ